MRADDYSSFSRGFSSPLLTLLFCPSNFGKFLSFPTRNCDI